MIKTKIVHIITSLDIGGAQTVLLNLVSQKNKLHENIVVNLMSNTELSKKFNENHIKLYELNIKSIFHLIPSFIKLIKILKNEKPKIVQTWLYHADLIGGICAKLAKVQTIIWNIRGGEINYKISTKIIIKINAFLSYFIPIKIIYCSKRSIKIHKSWGYKENNVLIRNGINTNIFKPSKNLKTYNRKKYGLKLNNFTIGMIARFDDQKDHKNLFKALNKLNKLNYQCILIGDKISKYNTNLKKLINHYNLSEKIFILDKNVNIVPLIHCLDLHVLSSSYGEAFPNVVAETMACGVPNIVTDIGDASLIIGKKNWVVEPKLSETLSKKIHDLYKIFIKDKKKYNALSNTGINRISKHFSIDKMSNEYLRLWNMYS